MTLVTVFFKRLFFFGGAGMTDIRSRVGRENSDRLRAELVVCFPALGEQAVKSYSREELVDKVIQCRSFLGSSERCKESLEGRYVLRPMSDETGAGAVSSKGDGSHATGEIAALLSYMMRRDEERERREKEEKDERERREKEEKDERLRRDEERERRDEERERREKEERDEHLRRDEERWQQILQENLNLRNGDVTLENQRLRSSLARDEKKDVRVKRASDVLRNTVGTMPKHGIDIAVFFYHLERQFELNAIDEDLFLPLLNQLLNDRARNLVARLSSTDASSYDALKAAILKEFQLTPSKYREHFVGITKRSDETFVQLTTRLEIALKYYLLSRGIEIDNTNVQLTQLFKLLVSDRIKENVPPNLMDFVRAQELDSWLLPQKLAELLDVFVSDRSNSSNFGQSKLKVNNSSNQDTQSPKFPHRKDRPQCAFCSRYGHSSDVCFRKTGNDRKNQPAAASSVRFVRSNSPDTKPKEYCKTTVRCYTCGGNHYQNYCDKRKPRQTNRVSNLGQSNDCVSLSNNYSDEALHFDRLEANGEPSVNRVVRESVADVKSENQSSSEVLESSNTFEASNSCSLKSKSIEVVLSIGNNCLPGIVDTGAEITVLPFELVSDLLPEGTLCGKIKLQGAFGESVLADIVNPPCKLVQSSENQFKVQKANNHDNQSNVSDLILTCAVTDRLSEKRVLLSLEDYANLCKMWDDIPPDVDYTIVSGVPATEMGSICSCCVDSCLTCSAVTRSQTKYVADVNTDDANESVSVATGIATEGSDVDNYDSDLNVLFNIESTKSPRHEVRSSSNFAELQKADQSLSSSFEQASKKSSCFWIHSETGVLFKRVSVNRETRDLLVLPSSKRTDVLKYAHDNMGHFASKKTNKLISRNFWWPKFKCDIIDYCSSCLECAQKRKYTVFDRVPIKPVQKPTTSFQVVAIDVFGPIEPASSRGHRYVLGIICLQSRWVECFPLKSLRAEEICDCILKYVSYAGIPNVLISDNGSSLVSKLSRALYQTLGIELRTSTPFHSQGNALIERFWLTFRSMLTHIANSDKPRDWDVLIPSLLFAYRNMPNADTGISPYQLVFGHECRNGLDVLYDVWTGNKLDLPDVNLSDMEFLEAVKSNLRIAQDSACKQATKAEEKYISSYKARDKSFQIGDQVLILMPDSSNKLRAKWIGPGTVVKKQSEYSYLVGLDNGAIRLLHANKLRKYVSRVESIGVIDAGDVDFGDVHELPITDDMKEDFEGNLNKLDLSHLSDNHKNMLLNLLRKYSEVFSDVPGNCDPNIAMHEIKLVDGYQPKMMRPYRIPEKLRKEVDKQIDDLLKNGKIRESNSPYGHPIVCVNKPSGEIRMCIDFRYVNQGTLDDKYPMKRVDDMIYEMCDSDFLTVVDAVQGYHQIMVHPDSVPLTSFVTHRGQFENLALPFGLKCASQTFQRALDKILRPVSDCAASYIDDVCCHSKGTFECHLNCLERLLHAISKSGLTLKLSKCHFAKRKILFCGHLIGGGNIEPNPVKVKTLECLPEPNTKRAVRSLIAMFRYYHSSIPYFSEIVLPLIELTKKRQSSSFVLNDEQRQSFLNLKEALTNATKLYSPKYDRSFIVHSDASESTVAACLSQLDDMGVERPIAFVSKKLSDSQRKWSVIEKEAFAIVYALKQFDYFIYGSEVKLYTDHNPLTYLVNSAPKSAKLTRWSLGLQRWNVNLEYKNTKANVVADCLTRI